jgi:hypothetical protein
MTEYSFGAQFKPVLLADSTKKLRMQHCNGMKSKDIRDALKIAKLTKSACDVDRIVALLMKYGEKGVICINFW